MVDAGLIVIASFISPFEKQRKTLQGHCLRKMNT